MQEAPRSLGSRAAIGIGGSALVVVGVAGLFLPVVPGVIFLGAGLAVLGRQYGWARRALARVTPKALNRPKSDPDEAEAA